VGLKGAGMLWAWKMERRSVAAVGADKSGRGCARATSRVGMKSRWRKGGVKSMVRGGRLR